MHYFDEHQTRCIVIEFVGPPQANCLDGHQYPDGKLLSSGGNGIVFALPEPFCDGFGAIQDIYARSYRAGRVACFTKLGPAINPSDLIMNELLEVKGIHQDPLAELPNIPSGVMQAVLMHALQLKRRCREVFLLCDVQRHSIPEAAMILGISRTAVSRRLHRARRRMSEVVEHLCGATLQGAQLKSKRTM
jgi:predicted DNA-binding protein (UPF0251 family)